MRVVCDVEEVTLTNDEGHDVESVEATCRKCGHVTESFGTDTPSIRRCLALMREECPLGQWNFYLNLLSSCVRCNSLKHWPMEKGPDSPGEAAIARIAFEYPKHVGLSWEEIIAAIKAAIQESFLMANTPLFLDLI